MPTKDQTAIQLAQSHFRLDPAITRIFRLVHDDVDEMDPTEPIKLLMVNEATFPYGAKPLYFRSHPSTGIHYPLSLIDITPEEFDQLSQGSGEVRLPEGWRIDQEILRSPAAQIQKANT